MVGATVVAEVVVDAAPEDVVGAAEVVRRPLVPVLVEEAAITRPRLAQKRAH